MNQHALLSVLFWRLLEQQECKYDQKHIIIDIRKSFDLAFMFMFVLVRVPMLMRMLAPSHEKAGWPLHNSTLPFPTML